MKAATLRAETADIADSFSAKFRLTMDYEYLGSVYSEAKNYAEAKKFYTDC